MRAALRSVMVKHEPDLPVFDAAFELVFGSSGGRGVGDDLEAPASPVPFGGGAVSSVRAGEEELRADLERAAGAGDEASMTVLVAPPPSTCTAVAEDRTASSST